MAKELRDLNPLAKYVNNLEKKIQIYLKRVHGGD